MDDLAQDERSLHFYVRKLLENTIPNARVYAEDAADVALTTLAVDRSEPSGRSADRGRRQGRTLRAARRAAREACNATRAA